MIEFKDVTKVYPNGTNALNGLNLTINDGELVFIVGASGAGKSTLTKLLTREERVTGGTITVDNINLTKLPSRRVPHFRRQIGMVFQDFRLLPDMTVYENVAFAMRIVGTPTRRIRERVPSLLAAVGLGDKLACFPRQLSGGEQQRVAIARALANNPKYIIADEPTGNIDPLLSKEMMHLFKKINEKNKTVIIVTHDIELVRQAGGRVVAISGGEVYRDKIIDPKSEEKI